MNKKVLAILLMASLLGCGVQNSTFANIVETQQSAENVAEQSQQEEQLVISPRIEKELRTNISKVYGEDKTDEIYNKLVEIAKTAKAQRPQNLKQEDLTRPSDWYKDEVIYMFYVDQFGTITPEKPNQFKDITKMLPYLKTLGVTTLYMLPFADSPMEDAGFDVKNPQNVRQDLGGKPQFEEFIKQAKAQGFNIKADLVLNHFSDQHEWFQKALQGDTSKLDYFITREDMPEYTKYVDPKLGTVVEYKENDGSISKRRLIFPEITENNYRKVTINGKDYYLYHTVLSFPIRYKLEKSRCFILQFGNFKLLGKFGC